VCVRAFTFITVVTLYRTAAGGGGGGGGGGVVKHSDGTDDCSVKLTCVCVCVCVCVCPDMTN